MSHGQKSTDTHERAYLASAHNKAREEATQLSSLRKADEIHFQNTGQHLQEAIERGVVSDEGGGGGRTTKHHVESVHVSPEKLYGGAHPSKQPSQQEEEEEEEEEEASTPTPPSTKGEKVLHIRHEQLHQQHSTH